MTVDEIISAKKAELYSLPFYQQMLSGSITPIQYFNYLTEIRFIHDYIDHKSDCKDFEDLNRALRLEVDKMECAVEVFPYQTDFKGSGIGEEYAIVNMFQGKDRANVHAYIHYMEILDSSTLLIDKVPGKARLYRFSKPLSDYQNYLNSYKPTAEWIDEVEKAYDVRIEIIDYLKKLL